MIYLLHWLCGQDKCQQPCSSLTDVSAVLRVSASVILAGLIIESSINSVQSVQYFFWPHPDAGFGVSLRFLSRELIHRQWIIHVLCGEDFTLSPGWS